MLTGAEALTHAEVAATLSKVIGKTIAFRDITPEQSLAQLLAAGLPPAYAEFLNTILAYVKLGYVEAATDAVARITGRAPISFGQYAHDYRQAWS